MKKNSNVFERSLQRSEFCIFLHVFSGFFKPESYLAPGTELTERCCFALETGCDSFFAQRMLSVSKVGQVGFFFDLADYFNGNI